MNFCHYNYRLFVLIHSLLFLFIYTGLFSMQLESTPSAPLYRSMNTLVIAFLNLLYIFQIVPCIAKRFPATFLNVIIITWIILVGISITFNSNIRIILDLNYVLFWTLTYLYYFFVIRTNIIDVTRLLRWMILLCIFSIILFCIFFLGKNDTFSDLIIIEGMNQIFYSLLFLPWVFMIVNPWRKNLLLLILCIVILFSMKRSALIIFLFSYFIYIFRGRSLFAKVLSITFCFCFLFLLFTFSDSVLNGGITDRLEDLESDGGSGRTDIWLSVWNNICNSSVVELFLGHGHNTVIESRTLGFYNLSAHNDYLEVLYDYGIFVFLLFILFVLSLIRKIIFLKINKSPYLFPYFISFIVFIVLTNVSHLILYPSYIAFLSSFWGVVEAETSRNL